MNLTVWSWSDRYLDLLASPDFPPTDATEKSSTVATSDPTPVNERATCLPVDGFSPLVGAGDHFHASAIQHLLLQLVRMAHHVPVPTQQHDDCSHRQILPPKKLPRQPWPAIDPKPLMVDSGSLTTAKAIVAAMATTAETLHLLVITKTSTNPVLTGVPST